MGYTLEAATDESQNLADVSPELWDQAMQECKSKVGQQGLINYVCGFLFDSRREHVVLIEKTKPMWQAGLLNGIGGKIEEGEAPIAAMSREAYEEIGISVCATWLKFAELGDARGWKVYFFMCVDFNQFMAAKKMEEEQIYKVKIDRLQELPVIPNLRWLIPMALSFSRGEKAKMFEIMEVV